MASLDTTPVKKSGMESLIEKPIKDRLAIFLTMLGDLQKRNQEKSGVQPITKKQIMEQVHHLASAKAYHDTALFFLKIFEPELREMLAPEKRREYDNPMIDMNIE